MDVITLPKLLDNNGNEVRRLRPVSMSLTETMVPLSTASMSLPKGETIPDRSWVEIYTPNGSAGVFRTRTPAADYGKRTNDYQLEHAICEVGDWLVRTNIEQVQKTLAQAIAQVFGYYGGSKWRLGTVSVSANVVLQADYSNVLQTINGLISQVEGAMMTFDFSTTPWTMNVVSYGMTVTAEGRLSRNVSSATIKRDDTNLCTRVWLDGLTGGKMDADTIGTYGVIERKLSGQGYTAEQAGTVASAYLAKYKNPMYSISIDGMDFSGLTGEALDRVAIGKKYRLVIAEDNVTVEENIINITWRDLVNAPNAVQLTLANQDTNMITIVKRTTDEVSNEVNGMAAEVESVAGDVADVKADIIVLDTAIETEVTRATNAENGKIAKTEDFQTVAAIIADAHAAADAAAVTAKNASIAKTNVYQTADAIVSTAVALAETSAGESYIAKTSSYQTADAIKNEAVRVAGNNAAEAYIAKSGDYATVQNIIDEAESLASSYATTAASGCIAKTSSLQTADAIVNTAVAQAATSAGNTYIAKTSSLQTADAIVNSAESYTDGKLTNYSTSTQVSNAISAAVGDCYGKVSGITITSSGVDVSGSQYVKIASGGYFQVTTGNFGIDTNSSGYVVWSGASSAASSPFRVKKDGTVYCTKLIAVGENGSETEVNLRTANLWKLNYNTIKTTTSSGGYCTSMTLTNGTTLNFNHAASVNLTGSWGGTGNRTFTVTETNSGETLNETVTYSVNTSYGLYDTHVVNEFDSNHIASARVAGSSGTIICGFKIDASSEYSAGQSAGASAVTLSQGGWISGTNVVSASNGKTTTVNPPSVNLSAGSFINHVCTVNAYVTGGQGSLGSTTIDATSEYQSGWIDGYNAAVGKVSNGTIGYVYVPATTTTYGDEQSESWVVSADVQNTAQGWYTGYAYVAGVQKALKSRQYS